MSGQIDELCVQIETWKDTCHDLLKKKSYFQHCTLPFACYKNNGQCS